MRGRILALAVLQDLRLPPCEAAHLPEHRGCDNPGQPRHQTMRLPADYRRLSLLASLLRCAGVIERCPSGRIWICQYS